MPEASVKPLIYLDIEGTGLDVSESRIIELCLYRHGEEPRTRRFNPGVPIPAEATEVHGITDDDVRDCPPFRSVSASVQKMVEGAVLVGYSLRRYDVPLLDAELRRAGQPGLPRTPEGKFDVLELDLYEIWQRHEPRTLVGAASRFAGLDLSQNAHSADADTAVLPHVLEGMVRQFGLQDLTHEELCALCVPEGEVDRDRKFLRGPDGVVRFNFGNSKGTPVLSDRGLLDWMTRKDFSAETKAFAREFIREIDRRENEALGVGANGALFEDDDLPF